MLKAQIEANEDVLVSEQVITLHKLQLILKASQILIETDTMELYTKAQAHQINQVSSQYINLLHFLNPSFFRVLFPKFLEWNREEYVIQSPVSTNSCKAQIIIIAANLQRCRPRGLIYAFLLKKYKLRIRDSIQKRTYQHVVGAYQVIFQKLSDPANNYPTNEQMKPVEEVQIYSYAV